jgi:integrase
MNPTSQTVSDFFNKSYVPLKLRSRSSNTIRLYRHTLTQFDTFLGRAATMDDLNNDCVSSLMAWSRARGNSARTANKFRDQLLAIWRFACRRGVLATWPDVEPEIEPQRTPLAWSETELRALARACHQCAGTIDGIQASTWWLALHLVLWQTMERIGAVMALEWDHVDLDRGWVTFVAEHRKGGRADAVHKIGSDCVSLLRTMKRPSGKVFPWPWEITYLWRQYGELLKSAGLSTDRRSKFHRMRRSAATHFKAAGQDPQDRLGHSDPRIMRQSYLDPRMLPAEHPADVLFRLDEPPPPRVA